MNADNLTLALCLANRGWQVFPCHPDTKAPLTRNGFKDATSDPDKIKSWWKRLPSALIGIYCEGSGIFAVDIDTKNGAGGRESWAALTSEYGEVECGPAQRTPTGGAHLIFKLPPNVRIPNNSGKLGNGLDLRSNGYICTGNNYTWLNGHGPDAPLTEAPAWLLEKIANLTRANGHTPAPPMSGLPANVGDFWLKYYLNRACVGNRNETGFLLACQLRDSGLSEGEAERLMVEYARRVPGDGYSETEALKSLQSAYRGPRREPAVIPGVSQAQPQARQTAQEPPQAPSNEQPEYLPLSRVKEALNGAEAGDAALFAEMFAGRLVFDHAEGRWYIWGNYWRPDTTREVYSLVANRLAPQYLHAAAEAQRLEDVQLAKDFVKRAAALRTRKRIENVLFLAAAHPDIALTGEEWDRNPWLLGVENGVIDLKTGDMRPGQPKDYIRSVAPTQWKGLNAPAPRFERFVSEIFDGNSDLASYLQRLLGYGITGLTDEHILPILHGEGRNGKSTLLETLGACLGKELAISSQADTLMDTNRDGSGPRPFVYALRGKRLVWTSESNEGRRINAGLVKQLTGGDTLTVRTLHSKPVTFSPSHLILLLTNNKPHIPADDQAVWDRVCLLPFNVRFVDEPTQPNERKQEKGLTQVLRNEAPGILAWLVRGCLEWQRQGLNPPAIVKQATSDYRDEEDTIAQFIAECCVTQAGLKVRAGELYKAFAEWCKGNGIPPMNNTAFGRRMTKRYEKAQSAGIWYLGIGLAVDNEGN